MKILVGFASSQGSTQGIAERVAARLREAGHDVEVRPLAEVHDASGYQGFVVGSAIHDGAWLPSATSFIEHTLPVISRRPVWLFSVGMPGALGRPLRALAATEGPKVIAAFRDAVQPRDHRLFTGVVTPSQLPRMGRIVFRLLGGRYGDFRDWPAIDAWADGIAGQLADMDQRG